MSFNDTLTSISHLSETETVYNALDPKQLSSSTHPHMKDLVRRGLLGTPLYAGGGAIAAVVISSITPFVISPLAGALVGGTFGIIQLISSLICKIFGIVPSDHYAYWVIKYIIDCAAAIFSSQFVTTAFGSWLGVYEIALLLPSSVIGAAALYVSSVIIAKSLLFASQANEALNRQIEEELYVRAYF